MVLLWFFDISTGFRFAKITVVFSVHICSCCTWFRVLTLKSITELIALLFSEHDYVCIEFLYKNISYIIKKTSQIIKTPKNVNLHFSTLTFKCIWFESLINQHGSSCPKLWICMYFFWQSLEPFSCPFGMKFWDVILGWYYNILGQKFDPRRHFSQFFLLYLF